MQTQAREHLQQRVYFYPMQHFLGGAQEPVMCCTEGCGLVGNTGGRWMAGMDDLFQPW